MSGTVTPVHPENLMQTHMIRESDGPDAELVRRHVDGPYILRSNGTLRWLTWGERIALLFGRLPVEIRFGRL